MPLDRKFLNNSGPLWVGYDIQFGPVTLFGYAVSELSSAVFNWFRLSDRAGGSSSGSISSDGMYGAIDAADVTVAGTYEAWFVVTFTDGKIQSTQRSVVRVYEYVQS